MFHWGGLKGVILASAEKLEPKVGFQWCPPPLEAYFVFRGLTLEPHYITEDNEDMNFIQLGPELQLLRFSPTDQQILGTPDRPMPALVHPEHADIILFLAMCAYKRAEYSGDRQARGVCGPMIAELVEVVNNSITEGLTQPES